MTAVRHSALACLLAIASISCGGERNANETVVLWHAYQGNEKAALEEVVADLNATAPETRIKLVSVAYDAFADKITTAVPNGNGPDLVIFAHDRLGHWVGAGVLEPVEYYVDEELASHYAYDAIAAMAYRGSLYGLPLATKAVALFYRTDLVDAPPRTTDELLAWAKARGGRGPYAIAYQNTDLYGHAPWLHGFGGRLFDADGNLDIVSAESIAALEFARSIANGERVTPKEQTNTKVSTMFNEGRAAMAISGPWFIDQIADGVPWKVTTLPVVSATGKRAAPFLGVEGVLMSARARDKDRAFAVMRALAGNESAIKRARRARQVVPNIAAYDEPDIGGDPVLRTFRDQLEHTVPMPATPAMRMTWEPYKTALQKVIAQGANAADALEEVQREVQSYIDGARAR